MFVEQLIKKMEECMISGFLEEGAFFSSWMAAPLLFSHSFYILGNLSILQNSPPLSRLFTFKYFNNYFPKNWEIALHEIFMLWLRGAKLLK